MNTEAASPDAPVLAARPWLQLALVLGEALLALVSGAALYVIISRIAGAGMLGLYALAISWVTLFQGVSSFGIHDYLIREVGAYGRGAADAVAHALLIGIASGIVAVLVLFGFARLAYAGEVADVIALAGLGLLPGFLNVCCRSVFLAQRRMYLTFPGACTETAIILVAVPVLLLGGASATALVGGIVAAKYVSATISVTLLWRSMLGGGHLRSRLAVPAATLRTVLTFGVGNMLGMLATRMTIIMASIWVDIVAIGHLAAATKMMEVGLMLPSLLGQLAMTRLAYAFNVERAADLGRFALWYRTLFAVVLPVAVGAAVHAEALLRLLFGPGFGDAVWPLRLLAIYMVLEAVDIFLGAILKAAHRQREDVGCLVFNPTINAVLNLATVPLLGILGAALSRVAGVAASATARHLLITRHFSLIAWPRYAVRPALCSIAAAALSLLLPGDPWSLLRVAVYAVVCPVLLLISSSLSPRAIREMMSAPGAGRGDG